MAQAVFEKREFTGRNGEKIAYDFYGVVGIVNGERMELALKELNGAEKIAFKLVASGGDPDPVEDLMPYSRKATADERPTVERKTILDDDDEEDGFLS